MKASPVLSNSRLRLLFSDLTLGISIILLVSVFRESADWILLVSWVLVAAYFLLMRRVESLVHQFLATLIAVLWVHFAKEFYGYKIDYLVIFGMNTLPLLAWTLALLGLSEVCNNLKLRKKSLYFLVFILTFWFLLILFETIAYHVLEVRNTMTGNYAGLPICDCIHAPTWMKVVYFSMGPIYYSATKLADSLMTRVRN